MKVEEPAIKYERLMSPREYLEWERKQELKHEYVEGFIITMQGASPVHNKILVNLITSVGSFLSDKLCQLYPSDMRTYVKKKESYFYPDASIICDENADFGDHNDNSQQPAVIFEILSPSTADFDLGKKFFYYSQIPSLNEYIVIDSLKCFARTASKGPDNTWKFEEFNNLEQQIPIETIGFALPLSEVYHRIRFEEAGVGEKRD